MMNFYNSPVMNVNFGGFPQPVAYAPKKHYSAPKNDYCPPQTLQNCATPIPFQAGANGFIPQNPLKLAPNVDYRKPQPTYPPTQHIQNCYPTYQPSIPQFEAPKSWCPSPFPKLQDAPAIPKPDVAPSQPNVVPMLGYQQGPLPQFVTNNPCVEPPKLKEPAPAACPPAEPKVPVEEKHCPPPVKQFNCKPTPPKCDTYGGGYSYN